MQGRLQSKRRRPLSPDEQAEANCALALTQRHLVARSPGTYSPGDDRGVRLEIAVTPNGKTAVTSKWEGVKGPAGVWPLPQILAAAHVWTEKKAFHNLGELIGRGG